MLRQLQGIISNKWDPVLTLVSAMLDDRDRDRYRPRAIADPAVSLINEPLVWRDIGDAAVLRRWADIPLRGMLGDALALAQQLLARLEAGLVLPKDVCRQEYEATIRQLYLRTQDQVRVLQDALALEELE
jgi:hypothetical protein